MCTDLSLPLSLQHPIVESLVDFTDPNMNRVASDIFLGEMHDRNTVLFCLNWLYVSSWCWSLVKFGLVLAIMKFMGDHPLRGQSEQFVVCTILKVKHHLTSVTQQTNHFALWFEWLLNGFTFSLSLTFAFSFAWLLI